MAVIGHGTISQAGVMAVIGHGTISQGGIMGVIGHGTVSQVGVMAVIGHGTISQAGVMAVIGHGTISQGGVMAVIGHGTISHCGVMGLISYSTAVALSSSEQGDSVSRKRLGGLLGGLTELDSLSLSQNRLGGFDRTSAVETDTEPKLGGRLKFESSGMLLSGNILEYSLGLPSWTGQDSLGYSSRGGIISLGSVLQ
uniref:Uncharacterized protein n=1 Tax=Cacopsylla melanoneura TaxID=428564 RepID=A0A8D9A2E2_9HEMI